WQWCATWRLPWEGEQFVPEPRRATAATPTPRTSALRYRRPVVRGGGGLFRIAGGLRAAGCRTGDAGDPGCGGDHLVRGGSPHAGRPRRYRAGLLGAAGAVARGPSGADDVPPRGDLPRGKIGRAPCRVREWE